MVLLIETFNKLYSKNHHHHHRRRRHESEALLNSHLQNFESEVSSCLNQSLDFGPEILSFPWILQLFQILPAIHQAFAKLVVNLEHSLGNWEADLADGYLNYSLNLLDFFNSISFSVSPLGQFRLLLSHALSLIETSPSSAIKRLKPVVLRGFEKDFKESGIKIGEDRKKTRSGKERAIWEALRIVEGIGYWVCGIVISALHEDSTAYLEARRFAGDLTVPSFKRLDSSVYAVFAKGGVVKEIKALNDVAVKLAGDLVAGKGGGDAAAEMRRRLEDLEKQLESMGKEVDGQFSDVLAGRSQLLDVFRLQKH